MPAPVFDAATIRCAARLACSAIYDPVTPDSFGKLYRVGESVCGTARIGERFCIVMQGTELEEAESDGRLRFSLQGWAADFDCAPFRHPDLGAVHGGFHRNLPALIEQLAPDIPAGARVVVTGHSKGAGEAALLGALLKLSGFDVAGLILFACPNPGYRRFAQWLAANLPGISYRNAPLGLEAFGDPVPLVPPEPYVPAYAYAYIDQAPDGVERLTGVEWHRGELYVRGVAAMP